VRLFKKKLLSTAIIAVIAMTLTACASANTHFSQPTQGSNLQQNQGGSNSGSQITSEPPPRQAFELNGNTYEVFNVGDLRGLRNVVTRGSVFPAMYNSVSEPFTDDEGANFIAVRLGNLIRIYSLDTYEIVLTDTEENLLGGNVSSPPPSDVNNAISSDGNVITGVFRRNMQNTVRYYFRDDNTVEQWSFGNRVFSGTYSISEDTITLYPNDGTTVRTLTISSDGQILWGFTTSYNRVAYTAPVFEPPSLIGRWVLTSTRGEFVPEELEFFEDGRMSSTMIRDGNLSTVWFYWSSRNGTLRYWRYDASESEAREFIYVLYHWVTESEAPGSRLTIRNLSGSISEGFQRIN